MSIAIQQLISVLAPIPASLSHTSGILLILMVQYKRVIKFAIPVINDELRSGECMLSSEDIVLKLKSKQIELEGKLAEFQCTTPESCVKFCLYKTALNASELLASNRYSINWYTS